MLESETTLKLRHCKTLRLKILQGNPCYFDLGSFDIEFRVEKFFTWKFFEQNQKTRKLRKVSQLELSVCRVSAKSKNLFSRSLARRSVPLGFFSIT